MARKRARTFACPNCGFAVRRGALACPECGSDAERGWSEDADLWCEDLPAGYGEDEDFDYEEALREEGLLPTGGLSRRQRRQRAVQLVAAVLVVVLLIWLALR
jgi:hypothetical protein